MGVSDKFLKNHSTLCYSTQDDFSIDKKKYRLIVDRIPSVKLRKLSEDDFKNGVIKLIEFDTGKIEQGSHGKIFYDEANTEKLPVVYELLCEIFLHTDDGVRLKSFHDITEDYYNKVMSNHGLTKDQFRAQVRLFLPYAKLERLYQLCKEENVTDIEKAALEVEECILYPELYREECCVILRNIYKSNEADLISFDVVPAQELPGNLGKYFKINLVATDGTETKTHHLFVKIVNWDNGGMSEFSLLPFRKERFFFESILESYERFGLEKLTDFCPKCYFANNHMLLFEDISIDGYNSWNFHIPVSYNWLATAVKLLAKLHATSIILEERLGDELGRTVRLDEEYPNGLCEGAFLDKEEHKEFRDTYSCCVSGYLLSKFPDLPKKIDMDALREKVNGACERMYGIVKKSDKIRNVLNHGDMWGANVMYKEDEVTQIPSAYLIDFQLIRYCPPSVDLLFLLYVNTDRATRLKHLTDLIELYYKELTHILRSYDIDVGNIFSFDQWMGSCREVEPMIICIALLYGQYMLMPEQFRKELLSDKERSSNFFKGDRALELEKVWHYEPFRSRIEGLVEDIVQIYENEM